jgi:RNA polymerase sigma factor (sigma-70 family)
MVALSIPDPAKTESLCEQSNYTLIAAVQQRCALLASQTDERHPVIRKGDRAFAELLKRYNAWIWKQVYSAADLDPDETYSACLAAFDKAIRTFDLSTGYALATYAYQCVRGALTALRRKGAAELKKVKAIGAHLVQSRSAPPPYSEAQEQREQLAAQVYSAIEQLSPRDQQIVLLHGEERLKFTEISERVGSAYDTTRAACRRAKKFILDNLQSQPTLQNPESEPPELNLDAVETPTPSTPKQGWMTLLWQRFKSGVRLLPPNAISTRPSPHLSLTETSNDISTTLSAACDERASPPTQDQHLCDIPQLRCHEVPDLDRGRPGGGLSIAHRAILRLGNLLSGRWRLSPAQGELEIDSQASTLPHRLRTWGLARLGLADRSCPGSRHLL